MRITKLFKEFYESEKTGGIILIFCTILSLSIANSIFQSSYISLWQSKIANISIEHWINDGLMAIFFLLVGLELKRELYVGELSKVKNALLPVIAAIGGMLIPATLYLLINYGLKTKTGAGIPMATDIAFAIGVLSLLGKRVPISLKIFLTALAVIDDLGAIIVIAVVYSTSLAWLNLVISLSIFLFLLFLNLFKVRNLFYYITGGIAMWYFMLHSGVHPTISGVLLAFVIPLGKGNTLASSYKLQHYLSKPVAFVILPLFALVNTAIIFGSNLHKVILEPYSLGISIGLIIGKPLGIILFSFAAVSLGICALPSDLKWKHIFGAGILAGIGFTMSIFITLLAFDNSTIVNNSKLIILLSSFIAGIIGFIYLKYILKEGVIEKTSSNKPLFH